MKMRNGRFIAALIAGSFFVVLPSASAWPRKKAKPKAQATAATPAASVVLSANETRNSGLQVQGQAPTGFLRAWFLVKPLSSNQSENQFDVYSAAISSQRFSRALYFRRGPGKYLVQVLASKDPALLSDTTELAKFEITNSDSRDMSFLLPSAEVQSDDADIIKLAEDITAKAQSAREKSRAIYDWVTQNLRFDRSLFLPTDALSTLVARSSRCSGYANLSAALHRAIGIRAKVVHGVARQYGNLKSADPVRDQHAWIEVQIGNEWVVQDPTWGESVSLKYPGKRPGTTSSSWFDPSAEAMRITHRAERITTY